MDILLLWLQSSEVISSIMAKLEMAKNIYVFENRTIISHFQITYFWE